MAPVRRIAAGYAAETWRGDLQPYSFISAGHQCPALLSPMHVRMSPID